jgi:Na+/proline symporter
MLGLPFVDLIVLAVYLIGITILGIWAAKLFENMSDYFMPRKFGKTMLTTHAFGTGTHADQAVSVASKTFTTGVSGIWYQWLWLFSTPFYWVIAPLMRRFRAITTADVFEVRYDRSVAMLFAFVGMFNLIVNIGVMLKGSGAVISSCFSGAVSSNLVILIMTALFFIYGMAGGLPGAIVTDFVQGILTVIFSFLLLPFVLKATGGISGLHEAISDPEMFSLVVPGGIGIFYIVTISINALVGIVTQPHTMGNCAAGRTEMDGRFGFTAGNFLKRLCTIAWTLTGLAALAYLAGRGVNPDHVYGIMAKEFLPKVMPGLLGVFLGALLATVMSSCDSFMIASSALFTENIYKPLVPKRSENHYITVGRITAFVVVIGALIFAFWLPGVVQGLEIFWKISSMMGIAFWMGLFWRRTTVAGAWAATLSSLFMWWLSGQQFFISAISNLRFSEQLQFVVESGGTSQIYLPWQMVLYLSSGVVIGVIVSLLTRPVDKEKLERYYDLVRTPVKHGEGVVEIPCTLPEGVQAQKENRFPTKIDLIGFFVSWGIVALLIFIFVLILKI